MGLWRNSWKCNDTPSYSSSCRKGGVHVIFGAQAVENQFHNRSYRLNGLVQDFAWQNFACPTPGGLVLSRKESTETWSHWGSGRSCGGDQSFCLDGRHEVSFRSQQIQAWLLSHLSLGHDPTVRCGYRRPTPVFVWTGNDIFFYGFVPNLAIFLCGLPSPKGTFPSACQSVKGLQFFFLSKILADFKQILSKKRNL